MICVPIVANNNNDAIHDMECASKIADAVELRIDYIHDLNLRQILGKCTKPVIVTNRPVREGGKFRGTEEERLQLLKQAIQLQADYVDIEHDSIRNVKKNGNALFAASKTKIIVSYHNFRETPENLSEIYNTLFQSGADIVKIVTHANSITDNIKIYQLLQQSKIPIISFCMGEYGIISRILYKIFGSYLTFASLQKGKESAPGQINIEELLNRYNIKNQNKHTAVYGLIGNPVSHSISPVIHNALFKEIGMNCVYVPFKVDEIGRFISEFKKLNISGYSVTIPHKESIINYLDDAGPIAKKIGAVNTVVNKNNRLIGFNTDLEAAVTVLAEVANVSGHTAADACFKNKHVTIIGAGGVARAIAFGLKMYGADITLVSRNHNRMQSLAGEVGCSFTNKNGLQNLETDIFVNATPVGMYPSINETPVDRKLLKPNMIVFDTIYNPPETKLIKDAKEIGCKTVGGMPMFIRQAAAQFRLWTDTEPPLNIIENIAYNA
ncbi:shikimate dehydrogenase [uncultured Candidatus Kuenenia sp.]|jgi:3-dehydroquinate dehydratase/shikimate dehydrogenase|uniref:shikimate dehydrogenase n=1 Tax=uncultured Candidatus Kuenenia sp. TaxID=1048336 RepID=UPI0002EA739F|nr:shikimate dehydrogenase [uncultured Candidatus Kuenenia sp.]